MAGDGGGNGSQGQQSGSSTIQIVPGSPPPPPKGVGEAQVNANVLMQLNHPWALSNLPEATQLAVVQAAVSAEDHGFTHAQACVLSEERLEMKRLEDGAVARKQLLLFIGAVVVLLLAAGLIPTVILLNAGQFQFGLTVMLAGAAIVSALLGGASLPGLHKRLFKSGNDAE